LPPIDELLRSNPVCMLISLGSLREDELLQKKMQEDRRLSHTFTEDQATSGVPKGGAEGQSVREKKNEG